MQKFNGFKLFIMLLGSILPVAGCYANGTIKFDGYSHIQIQESGVHDAPKGHTIQASIDGHYLMVVFTENVGPVAMEITTVAGAHVQSYWANTPDGQQTYIPNTGEILSFCLLQTSLLEADTRLIGMIRRLEINTI